MSRNISIKGTREGLTVSLGEGDMQDLLEELDAHLKLQGAFFKGGTVAVQLGTRQVDQYELERLDELLTRYDMALRTVVGADEAAAAAAQTMGLRVAAPSSSSSDIQDSVTEPARVSVPPSGALYVRRNVRSGQVVRHSGPIVVLGDVNPSAEVWAGGDVVIWGHARGMICAGGSDDRNALVCALDLDPLLLRIGDLVARAADERSVRTLFSPEVARVRDGQIAVEPWNGITPGV